jgi:hypothetical protein
MSAVSVEPFAHPHRDVRKHEPGGDDPKAEQRKKHKPACSRIHELHAGDRKQGQHQRWSQSAPKYEIGAAEKIQHVPRICSVARCLDGRGHGTADRAIAFRATPVCLLCPQVVAARARNIDGDTPIAYEAWVVAHHRCPAAAIGYARYTRFASRGLPPVALRVSMTSRAASHTRS